MRANRIDANQTEIIKYFRSMGCYVLNISSLKNCCDILVSKNGATVAIEIKDGSKPKSARRLTSGEAKFRDEWQGAWRLCESLEDAEKIYIDCFL